MNRLITALLSAALLTAHTACAEPAEVLEDLARKTAVLEQRDAAVRKQREARFLSAQADQRRLLDDTRSAVNAARARGDELRSRFDANEEALQLLESELQRKTGNLGELFGTVRQTASDVESLLRDSLVSAQYPGRADWFAGLAREKALPDIRALTRIWQLLDQEILASGQVAGFTAEVVGTDGVANARQVIRIGTFNAISDGRYLRFSPESGMLVEPIRQPPRRELRLAEQLADAQPGTTALTPVDPTRGTLLGLMVQAPDLGERIRQGGIIGYIIIGLGVIGLGIVAHRLVSLAVVERRVNRQLQDIDTPATDNPLGRVLAVATRHEQRDAESLDLQLDEAILRELPDINRGLAFIKLLAGIAPLLGLLGTVTGMIVTFQAISLFGTGDPKLMADGISQALVTTVLGLVVAIPLLFLHSLVATQARSLVQVLDEQTAGLVAGLWEKR